MEDEALFQHLVELMEKLSIKVVFKNLQDEEFKISGGLCRVRESKILIMDKRSPLKDRIALIGKELAGYNLEELFVPPMVREFLEKNG